MLFTAKLGGNGGNGVLSKSTIPPVAKLLSVPTYVTSTAAGAGKPPEVNNIRNELQSARWSKSGVASMMWMRQRSVDEDHFKYACGSASRAATKPRAIVGGTE